MPAGERKMPEPIVMPMTSATELQRPSVRGSSCGGWSAGIGAVSLARRPHFRLLIAPPAAATIARHGRSRARSNDGTFGPSTSGRDGALDAALDASRPAPPSGPTHPTARHRGAPAAGGRRAVRAVSRRARRAAAAALGSRGIEQLYTHQAAAIEHALAGRNVVVTTPTASGKTLCYNAPVLNAILQDPVEPRAVLFPTKALAQDQLAELQGLCETSTGARRRDRRLHLRRRHAAGRAAVDPRARAHRAQQPRHAALGDPAAPSALGEALREPALRRHRRAARVPRRVRQPSVQRAAAAAADLPPLRIEPGVHLLVGDDCEPARAGRAADRAAVRAGGRRAARRAARSSSSSSTRRSSTSSSGSAART